MKIYQIFLVAILSVFSLNLSAQGIEFVEGNFEEALAKAKEENKMIFMDAYASWCGPCKMLSRNIFPKEEVGEYFNKNFIAFKQDMEKGEGPKLARTYRVRAYPTLFFIHPDGSIVHQVRGAPRTPEALINVGKEAMSKFGGVGAYEQKYMSGDRSFETVYNYMKALNDDGQSTVGIANEYLDAQTDLSTPGNLKFLLEALTRVDSRIYTLFEMQKDALIDVSSEEAVKAKVLKAGWNTVAVASEYESEMILKDAQAAVNKHVPESANEFKIGSYMLYAKAMNDKDVYTANAKDFLNLKPAYPNAEFLVSNDILNHFSDDGKMMKWAEKLAAKDVEENSGFDHINNYAKILAVNGNVSKAVKVVDGATPEDVSDAKLAAKYKNLRQELLNG